MINIYKQLRIWILFSWSFLTIGILLGSWWAYHELGWGGWWFWDPVENASLMPWLLATAGIHSIIQRRLNSWAFFCIQSTFLFSIVGTFFVRSGLLSSVHSFATDSTRGMYLLFFLLLLIAISMSNIIHFVFSSKSQLQEEVCRKKKTTTRSTSLKRSFLVVQKSKVPVKTNFLTTIFEQLIILQNFYFCAICGVVFCGTTAPLLFQWFWEREMITGASFYNGTLIPLFTSIFFILIYAHYVQLYFQKRVKSMNTQKEARNSAYASILYFSFYFLVHLLIGVMILELNVLNSIYLAICFLFVCCIILSQYKNSVIPSVFNPLLSSVLKNPVFSPFYSFKNQIIPNFRSDSIERNEKSIKSFQKLEFFDKFLHQMPTINEHEKHKMYSFSIIERISKKEMNIAHMGIVFFILGILLSNTYKFEYTEQLKPGSSGIRLGSQICCLRSIDHSFAPTFHSISANILISQEANHIQENDFTPILCMFPEKRFYYSNQNIVATKVSIYSNLFTDFYSIIGTGNVDTGWFTTIMKLPFIFCIWLGFTFAFIGGILRLTKLLQKSKLYWL